MPPLVTACLIWTSFATATASQEAEPIPRSYYIDGATQIVRGHDTDGDGKLSRGEWRAMATRSVDHAAISHDLQAFADNIFGLYDLNQDQSIASDELALQFLYTFDCLDLNRDGLLSDEEAKAGIEGNCNPPDPREAR